jgi:hypothetical protein
MALCLKRQNAGFAAGAVIIMLLYVLKKAQLVNSSANCSLLHCRRESWENSVFCFLWQSSQRNVFPNTFLSETIRQHYRKKPSPTPATLL